MKILILILTILLLCFTNSNGQVPSNSNVPSALFQNYNMDVHSLALNRIFEVYSDYTDSIDIPQEYCDTIWAGLAAVFNTFPIPERDSVFDFYCIHKQPVMSFYFLSHIKFLIFTTDISNSWAIGNIITGNTEIDSLTSLYDFSIDSSTPYNSNWTEVYMSTPQFINTYAFGQTIINLFGYIPNTFYSPMGIGYAINNKDITYSKIGNIQYFNFTYMWGDCMSGCAYNKSWNFGVDSLFQTEFLGTTSTTSTAYSTPVPEWNELCYITIPPLFTIDTISFCNGDSIIYNATWYTESVCLIDSFTSAMGEDSLHYLFIQANPIDSNYIEVQICEGESFIFGDDTLTQSGLYVDTAYNTIPCYSINHVFLTVEQEVNIVSPLSICNGDYLLLNNDTIIQPGLYYDTTIIVPNTCDSVFFIDLTVNPAWETFITDTICIGYIYNFYGQLLNQQGMYMYNFSTIFGCDSSILLNLSVFDSIEIIFDQGFLDTLYLNDSIFELNCAYPTGGDYFGDGISMNHLDPLSAGIGTHYIYYSYTDQNGCNSIDSISYLIMENVSISELMDNYCIRIYPNPTSDNLFIGGLKGGEKITLLDLSGRLNSLCLKMGSENRIDLSSLFNGVYFIKIEDKSLSRIFKIIKL